MRISRWVVVLLTVITACSSTSDDTKMYQVDVTINPSAAGVINPSSDSMYEEGSALELSAKASTGYVFKNWDGSVNSTENPLSVKVDQDYNLVANFAKKEYDLTIEKNGEGEVLEQVVKSKSYEHGTVVELKAEPATGYEFVEWTGDINSTDNPKTIVMDGPKTVTAHFQIKDGKAVVEFNIDWKQLDNATKAKSSSLSESVTHVGVRIVYPNQNAAFAQSVEKQTVDKEGVITMEVPSSDEANLFAVAVKYSDEEKVLLFGTKKDFSIQRGVNYEWNVEDFSWVIPEWHVVDSLSAEYQSGTFIRSKNDEKFELWYLVNTPFITASDVKYSELIVGLNGTGYIGDYSDGYREYYITAQNPNPGSVGQSSHEFNPYLRSERFQLPEARYVIGKIGKFTVSWE